MPKKRKKIIEEIDDGVEISKFEYYKQFAKAGFPKRFGVGKAFRVKKR